MTERHRPYPSFFRPPRAAATPPIIPPSVSPIIPIVPYTSPTSPVVSPSPPASFGSSRNGLISFSSWASEKRNVSIKKIAAAACGFLKNDTKVAENCRRISRGVDRAEARSEPGLGKAKRCHRPNSTNRPANTRKVTDQANGILPESPLYSAELDCSSFGSAWKTM